MQHTKKVLLLFFVLCSYSLSAQDYHKYQSIFISNFIKYIEWPNGIKEKGLKIGVLGKTPVVDHLETVAASRGYSLTMIKTPQEAINYDLIVITKGKSAKLEQVLEAVGNRSTLIITEKEGLGARGSSINFVLNDKNALKFEINKSQIDRAKLKVNAQLLSFGSCNLGFRFDFINHPLHQFPVIYYPGVWVPRSIFPITFILSSN